MKIAFIGSGNVGAPLADHLQRLGHDVTLATTSEKSESVQRAVELNGNLRVAKLKPAVESSEVVFLTVPFSAVEGVLRDVGDELQGKILVDCTNPVGPGLSHGLKSTQSGSEFIQTHCPNVKVVKAFTIYGFETFQNSAFPGYNVAPAMLFCGNDAAAKKTVAGLITQLGWEPVDVGGIVQALALEHMTLLWVRMVRVEGHSPHLVWAALRRGVSAPSGQT